jgi:hypothetical protein
MLCKTPNGMVCFVVGNLLILDFFCAEANWWLWQRYTVFCRFVCEFLFL